MTTESHARNADQEAQRLRGKAQELLGIVSLGGRISYEDMDALFKSVTITAYHTARTVVAAKRDGEESDRRGHPRAGAAPVLLTKAAA